MTERARRILLPRSLPLVGAMLLAVALLAAAVYSLFILSRTTESSRHTERVRLALAGITQTITDAETGVRGYTATSDATFLEPYERALQEVRPRLDEIRALSSSDRAQRARIDRLSDLVTTHLELLAVMRTAHDEGRKEELAVAMRPGKNTMESIRSVLAELSRDEAELDHERERDAVRQWRWTVLLLLAGAGVFLVVGGGAWFHRRDAEAKRQRAEEVARAQELFEIVLRGTDMGITVQDTRGALVYANDAAATIIGYESPEALLAAPAAESTGRFELFDWDGAPFPIEDLPSRRALQGHASEEIPIRFRIRETREERWSLVRSVPAHDRQGNVIYAINFFREVTEKTREEHQRRFLLKATDQLNSSLDYERTLAAVARLAVPTLADWCAVDLVEDGQSKRVAIAHVDPAKVGFVADLQRRYPPDPAATTGVAQVLRTGKAELRSEIPRELIRNAAKDDEHLRLIDLLELRSYIGAPLVLRGKVIGAITFAMAESGRRYNDGDLAFAQALADRSALAIENARLFQEVERARSTVAAQLAQETVQRRDAEESARFAETFIAILGHDLRNPLNAISMAAGLLKRGGADAKTIARVEASTQRMSTMVDQLLDFTRSRLTGGIAIDRTPTDLGAVVGGAIDELALAYPGRKIAWRACEVRGVWDRGRLAQVVSNLVGNAVEHGDPERAVEVELGAHDDRAEIVVRSQGTPIAADLLPRLFEPYRRAGVKGARSKGLGLGLFISQQIVEAHGGRIDVRSTADEGTTFVVILPRRASEITTSTGDLAQYS